MMKKLLLLKRGVDVIRGTSKKKGESSAIGNIINEKFQGRYFFERAKTKKADKHRVRAAKSYAKSVPDSSARFGIKTSKAKDRLILKTKLTARETAVGRRLFEKFAPKRNPGGPKSQRQGRYGRIIVPKSALKRVKVDRKLTREVRKEQKGGIV
tara:strand:- start:670 stop:1131 length:462 start_codon:yes stop_codon:yes gene_type:complete